MDANSAGLNKTAQEKVIRSLLEKIQAYYVFPDVADQTCTVIEKHLADGDYTSCTDGELFALALTLHLQEVNHDEHLWVRWHPQPLPDGDGPLRHNPQWQEEQKLEARLDNYGLHRVERLPGNVGYLDIRYFHRPAWGGDTAVTAMSFLSHTNAIILDLRKCTGGYPGMIALICSYLFSEDPVHLNSIYWRDEDITQQYWTLPYIPGQRFLDKPVYVLTSKTTFSGGEEFAYDLQSRRRATVVGEKTDGGAHPGASYRLDPHFEVFIPIGRPTNPVTGTDWEGTGVIPDVTTKAEQAFKAAYTLALQAVIAGLGDPTIGPLRTLLKEAQAALKENTP